MKLGEVVDLQLFDGFDARLTRELAETRLGPPTGRWIDPFYKVHAVYDERPQGRVSLVRQGADAWSVVGHPADCTPEGVFRDRHLRDQLLGWFPQEGSVNVNVLRDIGWGGLTVHFSNGRCDYMVLTARDGDPQR